MDPSAPPPSAIRHPPSAIRHPPPRRYLQGNLFGDPIPEGEELRELWRCELFCQDHNYGGRHGAQSNWDKEVLRDHALNEATRWVEGSLRALAGGVDERVLVFNPVSWVQDEVVIIPGEMPETLQAVGPGGVLLPTQPTDEGLAVELPSLPPLAVQSFSLIHSQPPICHPPSAIRHPPSRGGRPDNRLLSEQLEVDIDVAQGRISRLFDRALGRNLVEPGGERGFGELVSYKDPGVDVRYHFTGEVESDALVNYEVVKREDGPVFARLMVAGTFLASRIEKEFTLYKRLRRVDLTLRVWWWGQYGEHLRFCFPFTLERFQETWYGVPFYAMRWPEMLHGEGVSDDLTLGQGLEIPDMLSPEDRRHFREVIGWLEVGYGDHGVTVGTRSTCWWINGSELHASLLRTQFSCGDHNLWNLNPGFHEWTFRLEPHAGDWREGKAYRKGEELLNAVPLLRMGLGAAERGGQETEGEGLGPVAVAPEHVMVTALKPSDFAAEALVVRVLECEGRPAEAMLTFPFPLRRAETVNLLEEPTGLAALGGRSVRVPLRPWQFQTIRLIPG
jgi:alpha-mannosidase